MDRGRTLHHAHRCKVNLLMGCIHSGVTWHGLVNEHIGAIIVGLCLGGVEWVMNRERTVRSLYVDMSISKRCKHGTGGICSQERSVLENRCAPMCGQRQGPQVVGE